MVFLVSAPSGAGKHTILAEVLARDPNLAYSISATTRPPRTGEVNGREYYFIDRAEFERRIEAGDFLEWAEVHDNLYGTLREEWDRIQALGKDVVVEIDVQGMRKLRATGAKFAAIFIVPPSMEELERRLRGRGTDSPDQIAIRIRNAREEWKAQPEYDVTIVNDTVNKAVEDMEQFMRATREAETAKA